MILLKFVAFHMSLNTSAVVEVWTSLYSRDFYTESCNPGQDAGVGLLGPLQPDSMIT